MLYSIKSIYRRIKKSSFLLWDKRLHVSIPVRAASKTIFKIYDFGTMTRYRASSFEVKEPETIAWIDSFAPDDTFLDIGANIGIFSLYAGSKGNYVVSLEPEALNYALLNLNINLNNFGNLITPYLIAAHNETKFSSLNISKLDWGGALNSFDNSLDYAGNTFSSVHSQGVYGLPLDVFLPQINFQPSHIKIDVDGNESIILAGAYNSLRCPRLRSLLIELDISRTDYSEATHLIEQAGFKLKEKTHAAVFDSGRFCHIYNHIYVK